MSSKSNYTEKQAAWLVNVYTVDFESDSNRMDEIVTLFNAEFDTALKAPSFRGKLMSILDADGNSIYRPMTKVVKASVDTGPTKKDILVTLAEVVNGSFDVYKLEGATKVGLDNLTGFIQELQAANAS